MALLLTCGIILATFHASHSSMPEFCSLDSDGGIGSNVDSAIYYDAKDDNCYPFIYKGEGGNLNRFSSEKDCIQQCSPNAEMKYPMDERDACHLRHLKGSICKGNMVRFYYDFVHDKCKAFMWKGCIGNGNRFLSLQLCNATCNGIHDDGNDEDVEGTDSPIALIVAIVLGLLSAILITVVIVLVVKSRNAPKKAPKKPKHEDLPLRVSTIEAP